MWKNKEIKKHARCALRKNYWTLVLLSFVIIFMGNINTLNVKDLVLHSPTDNSAVEAAAPDGVEGSVENGAGDQAAASDGAEVASAGSLSSPDSASNGAKADTSDTDTTEIGIAKYLDQVRSNPKAAALIAKRTLDSFNGTGGFIYSIMYQVDKFVFSHSSLARFLSIAVVFIYLLFYIFIWNALYLGYQRTLIESQTYSATRFRRIFSIFRMKGYLNSCLVLLQRTLFLSALALLAFIPIASLVFLHFYDVQLSAYFDALFLLFAIVCILVFATVLFKQYFSLLMVPYILAVNPSIKRKVAFKLSREMMRGNIIHYIGLSLSFIGWYILSYLTLGILKVFYTGPYIGLTKACLFLKLRAYALDANLQHSQSIKDQYLTQPPESMLEELEGVVGIKVAGEEVAGTGAAGEEFTGEEVAGSASALGADELSLRTQVSGELKIYPLEYPYLQKFRFNKIAQVTEDLNPKRNYTLINIILIFFVFSILGWCWEVMIHIVRDGVLVNRGTLHGPWLPVYGCGGVFIILLLKRFADRPYILFPATMLLCGGLEYFTSWALEELRGMRWWDYSNYFLNINGRICLEGLLTFAVAGVLFVYFFGPMLDNLLKKFTDKKKTICICVLILIFATDVTYSAFHPNIGKGITDYDHPRSIEILDNGASG